MNEPRAQRWRKPGSEEPVARLADALLGSPDVSRAIRRGRVLFRVGEHVFAVCLGRHLVVALPPRRASALVRAGLALRLDPGADSLLQGWVLALGQNRIWLRLAHEACAHARRQTQRRPMNPDVHRCLTSAQTTLEIGGTMAAPFVWFDLETKDEEKTRAFLTDLLQWDIDAGAGQPVMVKGAEGPWACVAPSTDGSSQWIPYVQVEDLDTATEKAGRLGATVLRAKTDGPAGEFAVIADPAGAKIALWQPGA